MGGNGDSPAGSELVPVGSQGSYLFAGQRIGKYEIEGPISTAGYVKVVYRAHHPFLADAADTTTVAIKVFRLPEDISNPRTRANLGALGGDIETILRREFNAANPLSHKNLARFLDYGAFPYPSEQDQNRHLYYLVEEYISGKPLSEMAPFNGQDVDWTPQYFSDVAYVMSRVVRGLAHLHQRNMAHLDIKPANVIVENPEHPREGRVVVTDFTHASKIFGHQLHLQGSRLYDAPEECGETPRHGTKADIWALGVMSYQALTGKYPFETSQPNWVGLSESERAAQEEELVRNILTQQPELPHNYVSRVPRPLEELCLAMLSKTDSSRPRSKDVARKLLRFASR